MSQFGPYYGDTMTVSLEGVGTPTSIPIGKAQSVEIRIEAEENEYFSAESTLRDVSRFSEIRPICVFEIGAWDVSLYKQWMGGADDTSTSTTLSGGSPQNPQKYNFTGKLTPTDGSTAMEVKVSNVTIPNLPFWNAERNEYVGNSYEGAGDDLEIVTDPA